ncbi:zinc-binding dehydrogenase [Phenylobacterium sp.]|jgi:NADPH:quinone reductase-like Zn-dependent oxidoreductase|uniref:zinc-binding dehydrogenase n=1 Tax=Phenylobacterium sp. TaxID=1871053 RepID=UPI002F93965E
MSDQATIEGLQLTSNVRSSGQVEVALARVPQPDPAPDEVTVRVEATPINPSDIGLLFGPADLASLRTTGSSDLPAVTADIPPRAMTMLAARVDQALPVGNEGAGTVVRAGASPEAQALMGRRVAMLGGAMYAEYRTLKVRDTLPLPQDASAADGASCFVNPLTALGMVETMRRENHSALVHTAAASNLGQMLNRICLQDGIGLVNVVRSDEQVAILRDAGAKHVVNSSAPDFMASLIAAITETGATIAFDAIGGGRLAGQLLTAMEAAAVARMTTYSRYGSDTFKQVYIYGGLDPGPTELNRAFGFSWALGGWLLTPFLQKIGPEQAGKLRERVLRELKTTFASHYTKEISLRDVLDPEVIKGYMRRATGEKYLINPSLA